MKISLNWIKEFVNLPENLEAQKLADLFTARTAEIEQVENQGENLNNIVVGEILEILPHPDATKLQITKTSIGTKTLQIVCGAPNIYVGQFVPVALVGSKVRWHGEGDFVTLEPAKIRGIESFGMICAGEEIGLEATPEGIMDLGKWAPSAGTPLANLFGLNDVIITVDNKSLTHRPDLWGHYGIAREIAAITGSPLKPFKTSVTFPATDEKLKIEVKDKKLCPRYLGVVMEGIKIEPSPDWLKKRLNAIGYRSINNIVDLTNYVMAELGQPLHAFDAHKIEGGIIVRKAKNNEPITTLDGVERKLTDDMLAIADHAKPLAIAGVMGGANSEISAATTAILIESATFHPSSVRKTSVKLGLRTEAVQRFEKSLDPALAEQAMDRICELILTVCPTATIHGAKTDIANFNTKKIAVSVDLKKVFSKIGVTIPTEEVLSILEKLEFKPVLSGKTKLKIEVPSFRATKDISIEDDLVEEIARMHGYENIAPQLPALPIKLPIENKERRLKHFARQVLSLGLGFHEVYNYSFYSLNDIKKTLLPLEPHIRVQNYLSEDQTHMRLSLMPNLLKNIGLNLKNFEEFKLFEIGRTYQDLQEYFPLEEKKIGAVIVKNKKNKAEPFYEAKGAVEEFLKMFRVKGYEMRKGETFCPYAHPNKYAAYYLKESGEELARIFEIHPLVAKNYNLEKAKIAVIEVNFSKLAALPIGTQKFKAIPKFPGIKIDISVLMDKNMEIGKIQRAIQNCDKHLIQEIKLFDIYEGPNIPADKKSLAFQILLQSDERTLTDEEMKNVQQKIFTELQKLGGEIRGLTK